MKKFETPKNTQQQGFTLIELSIVLVIIGLIVGGVLVGQDMIHAAEIRATIGQLEKYNAAVNTFRTKYNGLPGDLANPTNFGMTATDTANKANALIEDCTAGDGVKFGCETAAFWNHLSTANLIDGSYTDTTTTTAFSALTTYSASYSPGAKLGKANYIMVGVNGSLNYWHITGASAVSGAGALTTANNLTPTDAFQIDAKMDDGSPTTGIVQAYDGAALAFTLQGAAGTVCQNPAAAYNIGSKPTTQLCRLAIRTSF